MTTKNDAFALPQELAAELSALAAELSTFEARQAAINGNGGLRSKYNSRLTRLRMTHSLGDAMCASIGRDISRQCDALMLATLPPADSGQYVGYPRNL